LIITSYLFKNKNQGLISMPRMCGFTLTSFSLFIIYSIKCSLMLWIMPASIVSLQMQPSRSSPITVFVISWIEMPN